MHLQICYSIVPADWKLSNVIPVFKAGDQKLAENYRPISLLSVPSKLLERIVHNRLLKHLLENDLLSPSQFGFRPFSSTQEALVTATNDWHQYLDHGTETTSIFFDLSKAFDVLPTQSYLMHLLKWEFMVHYTSGSKVGSQEDLNKLSLMVTPHRQQVFLQVSYRGLSLGHSSLSLP